MSTLPFALLFLVAFIIVAFAFRRQERAHEKETRELREALASLGKSHDAQINKVCSLHNEMFNAMLKRERLKRLHWQEVGKFLWNLLDDIDTLDDSCRNNHVRFRERVRTTQRRRNEVATSDGHVLTWKHEQKEKS